MIHRVILIPPPPTILFITQSLPGPRALRGAAKRASGVPHRAIVERRENTNISGHVVGSSRRGAASTRDHRRASRIKKRNPSPFNGRSHEEGGATLVRCSLLDVCCVGDSL